MFLKLPFAVSFSVLFITIQYAVFRKSFRTFYVSLYIYIFQRMFICTSYIQSVHKVWIHSRVSIKSGHIGKNITLFLSLFVFK